MAEKILRSRPVYHENEVDCGTFLEFLRTSEDPEKWTLITPLDFILISEQSESRLKQCPKQS